MLRTEASPSGGTSLDLVAVSSLAVTGLAFLWVPALSGRWYLQVPIGILLVLFLPGYALVSAVFPAAGAIVAGDRSPEGADGEDADTDGADVDQDAGVDEGGVGTGDAGRLVIRGPTRVVLAMGLSAGGAPLVGIVLAATPLGVDPVPTLVALGVLTVLLSALAAVRRHRVGAGRYGVSIRRGADRLRWTVAWRGDRETVLNVLLIAGLLVAVAGLGLAVATSDNGERYTEFYLLAEDPETGDLVADAYPQAVEAGEPTELHVGIANREGRSVTYTVVVRLERVEGTAGTPTVTERTRLDTVELTVREGRTAEFPHTVEPTLRGESLRLTYLLYIGPPPENPGADTAHRSLHLWIDVAPRGS